MHKMQFVVDRPKDNNNYKIYELCALNEKDREKKSSKKKTPKTETHSNYIKNAKKQNHIEKSSGAS